MATHDGDRRYVVERAYSVAPDTTDVHSIVETRSGLSTLTVITCAGTFIPAKHAYDERLIVVARLRM